MPVPRYRILQSLHKSNLPLKAVDYRKDYKFNTFLFIVNV